jgi:hypothetical protein
LVEKLLALRRQAVLVALVLPLLVQQIYSVLLVGLVGLVGLVPLGLLVRLPVLQVLLLVVFLAAPEIFWQGQLALGAGRLERVRVYLVLRAVSVTFSHKTNMHLLVVLLVA